MPRNETVLYLLVASPRDVQSEREAVINVVTEWNQTWSRALDVRLEPLRYETHTHPNFDSDPQAVINKQIGDDYDIFIGILWTRFGSPTPRAASGTYEEFQKAYSRHKTDPESVSVKFYFKDGQIRPSEINVEQLKKVQDFKKEVSKLGGLYHMFTNTDEFAKLLRMHLSYQVQEWKKRLPTTQIKSEKAREAPHQPDERNEVQKEETEEEGFLDVVERGTKSFKKVEAVSKRMIDATEEFTKNMKQSTEEISGLEGVAPEQIVKEGKKILKEAASYMNKFSDKIESQIPEFKEAYTVGMDSFGKAVALLKDFESSEVQQIEEARNVVTGIKDNLKKAADSILELGETIAKQPPLSTAYNRAKRRTIEVLKTLETEMRVGVNLAGEVESIMDSIILTYHKEK